jgi:hypothetical protein
LRNHQQNTAGESNPAHFSETGIRGHVSLDGSDNHFAATASDAVPIMTATLSSFGTGEHKTDAQNPQVNR